MEYEQLKRCYTTVLKQRDKAETKVTVLTNQLDDALDLLAAEECRLLNAFQLIKNGVRVGGLKFDDFKLLMDKDHGHNGNMKT